MSLLKRMVAKLPDPWQLELQRFRLRRQIRKRAFNSEEPEYGMLGNFLRPGDWVIDVGANVGHYTSRFSELVGAHGRVIAFEPVPATFSLLSTNSILFAHSNVTLISGAISDGFGLAAMTIPRFETGLRNYYQASLSAESDRALAVLALPLDSILPPEQEIALIKIDVEGHEAAVLRGMWRLIESSHPVLIVETGSEEVVAELVRRGYRAERLGDSPNVLFRPEA